MTDPPGTGRTRDDSGTAPDRESGTVIPRWLKVVGIVVAVLALLVIAMLVVGDGGSGGGGHGPSRH